jgi:hypothetical protein
MKIIINFACVFLTALILVACAGGGGIKMVQRSDQDVARLMAVNDNLIVPGERIGPVFLGMTEEQLYKKFGEPSNILTTLQSEDIRYQYSTFDANVNKATHKVWSIITSNSGFHTAEGIKPGSSVMETQIKLGGSFGGPNTCINYNGRGLTSFIGNDGNRISTLSVWIPGGFSTGC